MNKNKVSFLGENSYLTKNTVFLTNFEVTKLTCSPKILGDTTSCDCARDKIYKTFKETQNYDLNFDDLINYPGFLGYINDYCEVEFQLLNI